MITPVILCGGSGTRLWPLSRQSFPKQFGALTGEISLFRQALRRVNGADFAAPLAVTLSDFRFVVAEQMLAEGIEPAAILLEPEGRNTGPALLAAALHLAAKDPDALMLALPSDHALPDVGGFQAAVAQGFPLAQAGQIVTFGIAPDRAETGYGWLEPEGPGPSPLRRFVEKPDAATAQQMLDRGGYLWNAGIFLMQARTLIAVASTHAPDMLRAVEQALAQAQPDLGFLRLEAAGWTKAPALSIDHAVMEKAGNLSVVPFVGRWSDLGDWAAVWREGAKDAEGNLLQGAAMALDSHGSLLLSGAEGPALVGLGLQDMMAVALPDAVLVAPRARAQEVRRAVTALQGQSVATQFARDHRPWGHFETLARGDRFLVKRITVKPGARLSLQSHVHRAEHWIVVAGTAKVQVEDQERLITENESLYIPLGAKHRLSNPGKVALELIEVQTGHYLAEDDIIRYEDLYARR